MMKYLLFALLISNLAYALSEKEQANKAWQAVGKQLQNEKEGNFNCEIPVDLKGGDLKLLEQIVIASDFEKHWTDFTEYNHIYPADKASSYLEQDPSAFKTKPLAPDQIFTVTGCKRKMNFEGTSFLVLKTNDLKNEYLVSSHDFVQMKKIVSNDFYKLYGALEKNDLPEISNLIRKVSWVSVSNKVFNIVIKKGSEETLDLLLKNDSNFPHESLYRSIHQHKQYKLLKQFLKLIPANEMAKYFLYSFRALSIPQLAYFKNIKKEDIEEPVLAIVEACSDDVDREKKLNFLSLLGFNFKEKGTDGRNAIHHFAQYGSMDKKFISCSSFLVKHGVNINEQDINGDTPAHRASAVSNYKKVDHLVSLGASLEIANKKGEFPKQKR